MTNYTPATPFRIASLECLACGPVSLPRLAFVLTEQCAGIDSRERAVEEVHAMLDRRSLVIVDTIDGDPYLDLPCNA